VNIDAREASLKRLMDTLDQVSGTKAEQISVRIQELAKYLDREKQYVEAREGITDSKQIKRVNKNIKKAVKQFNVNLSQLLNSGKPMTHDAWRLANRQFPELAALSSMIESHHGLGVKMTAGQVIEFTAPQWAEYDERLGDLLVERKITLRPGNVDPNAKGILKPFHQAGVHLVDQSPAQGLSIRDQAEATADWAETQQQLTSKFNVVDDVIEVNEELASIGAPANAAMLEAVKRDPSIASQVVEDLKNPAKVAKLKTVEGVKEFVSEAGLPSSMVVPRQLSGRLAPLFKAGKVITKFTPSLGDVIVGGVVSSAVGVGSLALGATPTEAAEAAGATFVDVATDPGGMQGSGAGERFYPDGMERQSPEGLARAQREREEAFQKSVVQPFNQVMNFVGGVVKMIPAGVGF